MPCSAAALVTSGSFAAPSSIEYSVCTCRCAKESDGLVTGGRAPRWSCVPDRRCVRRATGGEDRRCGGGEVSRSSHRGGLLRRTDRTVCRRPVLPQRRAVPDQPEVAERVDEPAL